MECKSINQLISLLPSIDSKRNYWFVRTNGGLYYDDFLGNNFIAFNYDEISLESIRNAYDDKENGINTLSNLIKEVYLSEELRPKFIATQLIKFAYEIHKGDIILIPSENSSSIAFGEVQDTLVFLNEKRYHQSHECPFTKRKKVNWLAVKKRDQLDPFLYKMFFSHQAITDANAYADYIDKTINSIFIKGERAHLVLDVQTSEKVKALNLFEYGIATLEIFDDYCKTESLSYSSKDFDIKINVQSPGLIELSGITIEGVILVGVILVAITGGGFSIVKGPLNISLTTDGLLSKVQGFLRSHSNIKTKRKLIEKHSTELQIKNPEELVKVLEELNKH